MENGACRLAGSVESLDSRVGTEKWTLDSGVERGDRRAE